MKELTEIKGIGPKTIELLNKMGIQNSTELLTYFPYRYEVFKRSDISIAEQDERVVIDGYVESVPSIFFFNKKMDKMVFKLNTGDNIINITIFNRGYLKNKLGPKTTITIVGKYDKKNNLIIASDLRFQTLGNLTKIEPIYHTVSGITTRQVSMFINELLREPIEFKSYIPKTSFEKYKLLTKEKSIREIHHPSNPNILRTALNHLKYEELFLFMLKMNYLKNNKENTLGLKREIDYQKVQAFIDSLDFNLTEDQEKSVNDIFNDLISEKRMNRLLQGDVGSGKTIVAIIAMYINYLSGYQSALMAPTEILANQHYENIKKIFKKLNINVGLLTSKVKNKERDKIYDNLENGNINIIIGTSALIQDNLKYRNLGLVITDEQHRFGVNQRSNLKNKGVTPDILYMSATPIPRTYALTIYGDMDVSNIKTMPAGRKDIITYLYDSKDMSNILSKMFIELKQNHQIYVIAPLIDESEKVNLENTRELEKKMITAFGKFFNIGVMHGKMTSSEKDEVMQRFKDNDIQILISTTVIEVGVDVKNATMIVIFDAYQFGLSALHQLRGRVGRNDLQSYCLLISDKETERLKVLTETTDGFKVSEEDFRLRGSGDFFGSKQSGDMTFKIADIKKDFNIILKAKEDSFEFLNSKEYNSPLYLHINETIEQSINLD